MAKFIIVLCAFVACAAAKPGLVAPLSYSAPLVAAAHAPLAYAAAPLAYANAHLDAAYASSRIDLKQNYHAAILPTTFAAAAPVAAAVATPLAAPVAAPVVAPLKYTAAAPLAYAAAPLAHVNAHLDAAYASNRVDVKHNYNAAYLPATYAAVAPLKYTAAAPVLF